MKAIRNNQSEHYRREPNEKSFLRQCLIEF